MKASVAVVLLLSSNVVAAVVEDRVDPPGATDTEVLKGNVLVWADAALYTEPNDGAPVAHVASLKGARKDSVGAVMPMHVVSTTKNGFVSVEPVDGLDCVMSRLQTTDDVIKLRLYVKRADLAPVLVEPFEKTFDNGTHIALRPGVPVVPTSSATFVIGVRGAEVSVELPATAVGHGYTPIRSKLAPMIGDREYVLPPRTQATLGDRMFAIEARAQAIEKRGDVTLMSIQTRCAALDVTAPSRSVRAVDADEDDVEGGSGLAVLDLRDHDYIPAGTQLSTPSGTPIAFTGKPVYLLMAPKGKVACFDRHVKITGDYPDPVDGDDKLRMCADATSVFHEKYRSGRSGNGTTKR